MGPERGWGLEEVAIGLWMVFLTSPNMGPCPFRPQTMRSEGPCDGLSNGPPGPHSPSQPSQEILASFQEPGNGSLGQRRAAWKALSDIGLDSTNPCLIDDRGVSRRRVWRGLNQTKTSRIPRKSADQTRFQPQKGIGRRKEIAAEKRGTNRTKRGDLVNFVVAGGVGDAEEGEVTEHQLRTVRTRVLPNATTAPTPVHPAAVSILAVHGSQMDNLGWSNSRYSVQHRIGYRG